MNPDPLGSSHMQSRDIGDHQLDDPSDHITEKHVKRWGVLVLIVIAFFIVSQQLRASLLFSIIASKGDTIDSLELTGFFERPTFNNNGTTAFIAAHTNNITLFTQSFSIAGSGDTIAGKKINGLLSSPSMSDAGDIVFAASHTGGYAIFDQASLRIEPGDVVDTREIIKIIHNTRDAIPINTAGNIAYLASFTDGFSTSAGIFDQSNLLVELGEVIDSKTVTGFFTGPSLNDFGDIAFIGSYLGGMGIFSQDSLLVGIGDTIDGMTITGIIVDSFSSKALNDNGDVVFLATYTDGISATPSAGIFTQNALLVQMGDVVGGKELTGIGLPAVNDAGTVAYIGSFAGGTGIFTQNELVVQIGDVIGSKIISRFSPYVGINDAGEVMFLATFTDGDQKIILAQ